MALPCLLVPGLTVDIFSRFSAVFIVHCAKLMLRVFEFGVLLLDCFVNCQKLAQNVTCLKRFTRYGHYTGEVKDSHRQTCSCLFNSHAKN